MHKYVLAEPTAGASSAQHGSSEGQDEEAAAIAAAKAGAAAHFGGSTHQHQPDEGAAEVEAGGEEARVGHAMVKPVDGAEQQQQQQKGEEAQPGGSGGLDDGPGEGAEPAGQTAARGGEAAHIGHSMVKPVGEQDEARQPQPDDSPDSDFLAVADKQQQQQPDAAQGQQGEAEAAQRASSTMRAHAQERHGLDHAGGPQQVLACGLQCAAPCLPIPHIWTALTCIFGVQVLLLCRGLSPPTPPAAHAPAPPHPIAPWSQERNPGCWAWSLSG